MERRRRLGMSGERRAAAYLLRRGWRIAGRNVRIAGVEIDILASHSGVLVAVEVKTRSTAADPEVTLSLAQRRRLAGAVTALAARRPSLAPRGVRVDLIIVGARPLSPIRRVPDVSAEDGYSPVTTAES